MSRGEEILLTEINNKKTLLARIRRAVKLANKMNFDDVEEMEISKSEMLELLEMTAGDEEFYESHFEIHWCGYKCSLYYGAENHNNLCETIQNGIDEDL